MIIDWHAHVYPPELARERRWGGMTPLTIENLLEAHEQAGIDRCVVSNTIHYLKDKTNDESLAFLRRWNEYGAEIQQKYQDRILVFTSTLPCGGAPSDAPPLLPLLPRAKKIIEELPISRTERDDIFSANALKLLQRR